MLTQYSVEYSSTARRHSPPPREFYYTDDPLACQQFLQEALLQGHALYSIRHDGSELPRPEFDRLIRQAAQAIASRLICTSLNIKIDEERYRFGFAA